MASDTAPGPGAVPIDPSRRAISGAVAVTVGSLLVAALIFSNSMAARGVADDARILHQAESTLGATQIAMKALSQAVLLAEDEVLGVADTMTTTAAITEAADTLSGLSESSHALLVELGDDPDFDRLVGAALSTGGEVVGLLSEGRVEEAGGYLAGPAKEALEELRDATNIHRGEALEAVDSTSKLISRVGNLPAFLVAFLIPGLAIVSYRRIARGQLRLAEVQLDSRLESERHLVRAKDEFVANISHELRTPLTSIYGFSELLIEQGLVDPELALELVGMINAESAELHRMVEDLLTSARHEAGTIALKMGPIDLASTIGPELAKLDHTTKSVETDFLARGAWADEARVRHIVRNLLSNAYRYGGNTIRLVCDAQGDHAAITVADDGSGVEPAKVVRLFTRYVHDGTDPLMVGSVGLGLSVVRILAEAMGGDANYRREDGWSGFTVRLPLDEQAATSSRLPPARTGSLPPHIVAAEDSGGRGPIHPPVEEPSFEAV